MSSSTTGMQTGSLASGEQAHRWSPARIFMAVSAAFHIPIGVVGMLYHPTFPIGAGATRGAAAQHLFGVLETNGWHTLGALAIGLLSLHFTVFPRRAGEVALAIGVFHVAFFLSLVLWDPSTFWIASNGADQVIHASTATAGTVCGLLTVRRTRAEAAAAA